MKKTLTTCQFISKAKNKHGTRYSYDKTEYIKSCEKVIITCSKHGDFLQTPNKHTYGRGCPLCGGSRKLVTSEWIVSAKKKHGNTYDYSKTKYVNAKTPVLITCNVHGDFLQVPDKHKMGQGCPMCGKIKHQEYGDSLAKKSAESFVKKSTKIHGKKYSYSKSKYHRSDEDLTIICEKHGEFSQTPDSHLSGSGCPKCIGRNLTLEEWRLKCKTIHGGLYSYEKSKFSKTSKLITITCPKHGDFSQKISDHTSGKGCQLCGAKIPNTDEWIEKAKKVHGNLYDYSKSTYSESLASVTVLCSKHGYFKQRAGHHLEGRGCPSCGGGGYNNSKEGYFYIQILSDKYIKFGITNYDPVVRMRSQEKKSIFSHRLKYTFKFNDGSLARKIESRVKKYFNGLCGVVSIKEMPDGYTETLPVLKLTILRIKVLSEITKISNRGYISGYSSKVHGRHK